MKWKKGLWIILLILFLTGCNPKMKSISYQELKKLEQEKKTFVLEVMQDGCAHCEEFTPRIKEIVKKYKLENIYQLNLSNLSKKEEKEFLKDFQITSTPTTCFFKRGKELGELYRIEGAVSKNLVMKKLKNLKYIK